MKPTLSSPHLRAYAVTGALALLAGLLLALGLPGTSAAATPCGQKVLADWFDNGRIDRIYPLHCYEEAIDAIPIDLRDYADAEDVISRALQAAINGDLAPGGVDPTPGDDGDFEGPGAGPGTGPGDPGNPGNPGHPGNPNEPDVEAAPEVDTTGLSSLPIPLLVLGGMSLALLAAGGLGYLSRRRAAAQADGSDAPFDDDLV